MRRSRIAASVVLALGVVAASGLPAVAVEQVIPSERCRGLWLVPVRYGDEPGQTLRLVFDTGASHTSVDPDAVERVFGRRLQAGKKIRMRDGQIGPLSVKKLRAEIHEMDHLSRALGTEIDGILGHPTFKSVLLTLDYPAGEIRIDSGSLPRVDQETIFEDIGKLRSYLALDLGEARVPLLVDSGFSQGIDLRPEDPIDWAVEPRPIGASVRYDGIEVRHGGRTSESWKIGPLEMERPVVRLSGGTRLLGALAMSRFTWTFDQRKRRIRIVPDGDEPIRIPPQRGIGAALRPRESGFEVLRVFEGSPAAEAGLKRGDLIVAIDGVPILERGCEPALPVDSRDQVVLTLVDGDVTFDLTVDVVELVP